MRSLWTAICLCLLTAASPAWAQFGMYGLPELLQVPQVSPSAVAPAGQAPGAVYATSQPRYASAYGQSQLPLPPNGGSTNWPPLNEPSPATLNPVPDAAGQGQGIVSQILSDPALNGAASSCNGCQESACGSTVAGCCEGCCVCPWYGSLSALVLGRDCPNKVWTSYEDRNNPNQVLNTEAAQADWRWGGEIRFGRRFCCNQWAVEADFWTVDPLCGSAIYTNPSGVSTPLHVSEVGIDGYPNNTAEDWFDGAAEHRLSRRDQVYNVEINFLRNGLCCGCGCCTPWSLNWLAGLRFFRFEEELSFGSLQHGYNWTDGAHTIFMDDEIANNLWGAQFGFSAGYCLTSNLKVFALPKFGIYNNHIDHYFQLHLGDGTNANTGDSGVVGTYPVSSSIDRLSFITELDLGIEWQLAQHWGLMLGYRVVVATGIGLADNQIPPYLVDIPAIRDIDGNGQLVLHGAFAGVTYNF